MEEKEHGQHRGELQPSPQHFCSSFLKLLCTVGILKVTFSPNFTQDANSFPWFWLQTLRTSITSDPKIQQLELCSRWTTHGPSSSCLKERRSITGSSGSARDFIWTKGTGQGRKRWQRLLPAADITCTPGWFGIHIKAAVSFDCSLDEIKSRIFLTFKC